MEHTTKVNINWERKTALELKSLLTKAHMSASLLKIKDMVKAYINTLMVENITGSLFAIKGMVSG